MGSADAEPEADAYYGYYGYARPYAYGYRSYGYPAYGYYGKRSADAEPKADADAYYGVYGYPYAAGYAGYAYGAYPYAYGAYYERDLLMLSQRLTPTTMDMPDLMPMDMPHMLMVLMDVSGDKLNATQLRSSKANIKYQ